MFFLRKLCFLIVIACCGGSFAFAQPAGQTSTVYTTGDKVPGNPDNEVNVLKRVYKYLQIYRQTHDGDFPDKKSGGLFGDIYNHFSNYGFKTLDEAAAATDNPDTVYADSADARKYPDKTIIIGIFPNRFDGSPFGSPKPSGTKDVWASSNIYNHLNPPDFNNGRKNLNPVGFYMVLWDDGEVQKVPYDQILYAPIGSGPRYNPAYPGQAGVPWDSVTYAEFKTGMSAEALTLPPIGYPLSPGQTEPKPDNGGIESLVTLTRLFDHQYDREQIWDSLGHQVKDFMLQEVMDGAAKINFPLQKKTITLDELQKLHTPAMLYLSDTGRIVTMSTIDDNHAIILDRGTTLNVSRAELSKRYSGEALIATSVNAPSLLVADQPIRTLEFSSKDAEVVQNIKITNHGTKPVSLLIAYPLCGITTAKLSQNKLAPGESSNLELHFKWRTVLFGDHQSTFVTLKTDDPAQPRLQLGFDLKLTGEK